MTNFQEDRATIDTAVNSAMFSFFNLKDTDEKADYRELADGLIEMIKRTKVHFIEVNEKYIAKELTPEFEIFISGLINIDRFPIDERKEYYLAQIVPSMEQSTEALLSIQAGKQMLEQFKQQIISKIKLISH